MTTTLPKRLRLTEEAPAKRVGLVLRVSTDRQAANDEGSLKNQIQRLRAHIEYKTVACGEQWVEAAVYELRAVSGKDSMRSDEFDRLFADIRAGRVNTVLCTALDRICRSVKDFLWFFEFLNEHSVEFVCLKQNYDTTSSQGKLFVTIMMALAEFEREQTSERTKDAAAARSERGLWNGGRILGYDADPNRKGSLVPNPQEAVIVDYAFDKYLECGSLVETPEAMSRRGFRTKGYTSRRGVHHTGQEFSKTTVQYLLQNVAYIGKKVINKRTEGNGKNKGPGYRVVDAVWPAIVDVEKFEAVQRLMAENGQTRRNAADRVRHTFVLGRGILHCGRCGTPMDGRSGTGSKAKVYFYYVCKNKDCGLRVSADEVEAAVLERIRHLASDGALLEKLTEETNNRLQREKPALEKRKGGLMKDLEAVKGTADRLVTELSAMGEQAARGFLTDKLNELAQRKIDLERGLMGVEDQLRRTTEQAVDAEAVREALGRIHEVYGHLRPYEQRELITMVLKKAVVNEREIALEIYALGSEGLRLTESVNPGANVRTRPDWLPE